MTANSPKPYCYDCVVKDNENQRLKKQIAETERRYREARGIHTPTKEEVAGMFE